MKLPSNICRTLTAVCAAALVVAELHAAGPDPLKAPEPALRNSLDMIFAAVPAGKYVVGPPELSQQQSVLETANPAAGREIEIAQGFLICAHETRVSDYRAFVEATGRAEPVGENYDTQRLRWLTDYKPLSDKRAAGDVMPISCVTYADAVAFCQWLSAKEGRRYRLPTEVEWEYAARSGFNSPYLGEETFGVTVNGEMRVGMVRANPREVAMDDIAATRVGVQKQDSASQSLNLDPSSSFPPNRWGLYHVLGNVQELVTMSVPLPPDDAANAATPLPALITWKGRANQALRGGSWLHDGRDCSVFRTLYTRPDYTNTTIGFRVLLELPAK